MIGTQYTGIEADDWLVVFGEVFEPFCSATWRRLEHAVAWRSRQSIRETPGASLVCRRPIGWQPRPPGRIGVMKSRWSDTEAKEFIARYAAQGVSEDLALRTYTTRLLGSDPKLVLHGGGNTSVKTTAKDQLGEDVDVLCVKGSGWDMGNIEPQGLPAVRLAELRRLRKLPNTLSDEDMVNFQRINLLDSTAPKPERRDAAACVHSAQIYRPHPFDRRARADRSARWREDRARDLWRRASLTCRTRSPASRSPRRSPMCSTRTRMSKASSCPATASSPSRKTPRPLTRR